MEATSAPPILLPGIDHLPCLQETRSVKDKPFYCQSSVGTIPFQGRVFLLLPFCNHMATIPCLLTEKKTLCLTRLCAMKFFSRLVMWLSPITRTRHHLYHSQHRYRIFRLRHVLSVEAISAHKTLLFYVVCVPVLLVRRIVSEARI